MIKKYNPITPSLRHRKILKSIPKFKLNKNLIIGNKKTSGRNNQGKITSFRKGGGHKKNYRLIDHSHILAPFSISNIIRIEYNPFSSSNIAYIENNKNSFYRLATQDHSKEIKGLYYNQDDKLNNGDVKFIKDIPAGTKIIDLEGKYARSAGTSCKVIKKLNETITLILLPTGIIKEFSNNSTAIIGENTNSEHKNTSLGKAGASRWLGIKPKTRGEAMNPVDHPHGGKNHGSGGKGNPQKNRWGKLAKSKK